MTNEQKKQINEAVEALELTSYDVLYNIEYNGEITDTVMEIEFNGVTFLLKAIYKFGHSYSNLFLSKHPLYIEHLEEMIESLTYNPNQPEYTFDGKTITNPENIVAFNTIADKISINTTDNEAMEHLACKLEEHIVNKLSKAEEEMFDEVNAD